jgi:hypothetical protein
MPQSPSIESDARGLLLRALEIVENPKRDPGERRNAATLAFTLSDHVASAEDLCTEVLRAARASLADPQIVGTLLLAAETLAPDCAALGPPILRLCETARLDGHASGLLVGITRLLGLPRSDERPPSEWLTWAAAHPDRHTHRLQIALSRWASRIGAGDEAFLAVHRQCHGWMLGPRMEMRTLRAVQTAEPTSSGWRALARRTPELTELAPSDLIASERRADALDALATAIDEERAPGIRAILERWRSAIESEP